MCYLGSAIEDFLLPVLNGSCLTFLLFQKRGRSTTIECEGVNKLMQFCTDIFLG